MFKLLPVLACAVVSTCVVQVLPSALPVFRQAQKCSQIVLRSVDVTAEHSACENVELLSAISDDTDVLASETRSWCEATADESTIEEDTWEECPTVDPPLLQIRQLFVSGPSTNRVDLVFFSDGYLPEEQDKFIGDATRLAQDISGNQTFNTVKPLLNFWAAFSPSNESGIGVGGIPKDTPFGLYRDGTELRGVYYDKPEVARAACDSMGDQCDYPILLGNDPYYGGLGGEFTVITSSLANGPLVLRHELGHSIIDVGEEYDGGFAYFGVNSADDEDLAAYTLPWEHWLSDPDGTRVERSVMPMQAYPWTLLNTTTPWIVNFTSSGLYSRHVLRFSLSGILPSSSPSLTIEMDGMTLPWEPMEGIGLDRWHYDIHREHALAEGVHGISFTLLMDDGAGKAQLCNVEVLEFGDETEFDATPGHYGIYPTFSETNEMTYRPTNEDCLMRVVTSPNLCKVCVEGLWHSLLRNINFIDGVHEECVQEPQPPGSAGATSQTPFSVSGLASPSSTHRWKKILRLDLIPLAQFRLEPLSSISESYTITWSKHGQVLSAFANQTRIELEDKDSVGEYSIEVKFATDEVRSDEDMLLVSGGTYSVVKTCDEKH